MKFNERLRELRRRSTLTQKEIAAKLNISVSAYQYYESGKSQPNLERLVMLADMFDVSTDYLLCRSHEASSDES